MTEHPTPRMLIGGTWTAGSGGATLPVINPATGETLTHLPVATRAEIGAALDAAEAGFRVWRAVPPIERARILAKGARRFRERIDEVAMVITLELGKPLAESRAEVTLAAEHVEWAAQEARRGYGQVIPARDPGVLQYSVLEPVGPVAAFAPWNAPAITPARKLGGALAAGCSVILKPAEEAPSAALILAESLLAAGVPDGALNIVFGDPPLIGRTLAESPRIKGLTFTGSTAVGAELNRLAAPSMVRTTLELGGHAPVIILGDVDVERVARTAIPACLRNSGQVCTSPTRFLVHASVYDQFLDTFVSAVESLKVGDGRDPGTQMGPVATDRRLTALAEMTDDARTRGATVATGGHRLGDTGTFWSPTVLTGVPADARAATVEPFGPLKTVARVDDLDEALAEANRLPFGLASYAWTHDSRAIARITDEMEAGSVAVNSWKPSFPETPFGGFHLSGLGTEGGVEGVRAFQRLKYISRG
ncbi:Alpha-ketoglutaric semialdehyde dehydrogenase [Frankia canadensis]|uniref:Alpha-ketoglutaric semialdehyde dehydrogenase n=1 Tax=Frankia canadensis TaxID=1836972 RepID=A0A2I2KV28_9ACTN|nr:NAD-dependent succinate-semialdehyde dehydrogenase [Frankia canadensis]SNQ49533.1 Alpha-ketoglutaric semialdehyde dehydrogenase [Frankia canadensis]SOU56823.1 Alpha-ketoglutaric semialdehyde dehydrogenase [Frankia canadensis]